MPALKLKRRTVLKGLFQGAAVSVGLPSLEAMFNANGTAHADGTSLPRRLGIFFWGNGVRLAHWNPAAVGADYPLSRSLMPLAGVRDYMSVVSGAEIKFPDLRAHHTGSACMLSGAQLIPQPMGNAPYRSTFAQPSLDQVAAAKIGGTTRFKSLELGISRRLNTREGTTLQFLSHNGPDSTNPPTYDPAALFMRLFGGGVQAPGTSAIAPEKTAAMRKSVLDAVTADLQRLKMRASSSDRTRLDQHLENVRGIESRIQRDLASGTKPFAACTVPSAPAAIPGAPQGEPLEPLTKVMSELLAMALACDLTRVFSMLFSGSVCSTLFWQVGLTQGHHQLSHDEPGDQPQIQASTEFTMKLLAILIETLKNTPEGQGNLLDQCAILATSDCAEGKPHSIKDYPILVIGKAGGFLKHPGIHYRSKGENVNLVSMSLLRAVEAGVAQFGGAPHAVASGLSAIEA